MLYIFSFPPTRAGILTGETCSNEISSFWMQKEVTFHVNKNGRTLIENETSNTQ